MPRLKEITKWRKSNDSRQKAFVLRLLAVYHANHVLWRHGPFVLQLRDSPSTVSGANLVAQTYARLLLGATDLVKDYGAESALCLNK